MSLRNHGGMFDALQLIEDLQAAVQRGDRERVEAMVSDRMIWVMPLKDNARGKVQWIEASLGVTWNWFRVSVHREVDLGQTRIVESWIKQSREPVGDEDSSAPVIAEGVVVDVWTEEDGAWRLVSRHPQRTT
ncbi:nuclear transport factor 2 family protein [Ornithinibacter aureus]|uniref:nuclear transport factor 2 family protein n=1 Tax=Ornithinibacter aureus TaxID=622664 RepID=UPI0013574736|nr:nuclear transport factor 2 family protein [Ornithinibacter aureus]